MRIQISSAKQFIDFVEILEKHPSDRRLTIFLPQLQTKKHLIVATSEERKKMDAALQKADAAYQKWQASLKTAPRQSRPPIWKMGLAAGVLGLGIWAFMNSNVFVILSSLGATLSRDNMRALIQNPNLLLQTQTLGQTLQNWNLIEQGHLLTKICSDCDDPERTLLAEAARMRYDEIRGKKVWLASDETLRTLFQLGQWTSQDYRTILEDLLSSKRYDLVQEAIGKGWLKGEYFISVHIPALYATFAKAPAAIKLLQTLFCTQDTAKEFLRHDPADARDILAQLKC